MKLNFKILSLLFLLFISKNILSQEISLNGFYQADLLFDARPGISVSYNKNFSPIFSLELEYGNQYINQSYSTLSYYYSTIINPKDYLHNTSLSFLISVYNSNKFEVQVGSKHSFFLLTGKENVHSSELDYTNDTTPSFIERDYVRNPLEPYYSYSNELKFKIKEVIIPNISVNVNLSAGFILNGTHPSGGCLVTPPDILAPYSRFGIGISYNLKK